MISAVELSEKEWMEQTKFDPKKVQATSQNENEETAQIKKTRSLVESELEVVVSPSRVRQIIGCLTPDEAERDSDCYFEF